jgi:competence protein ComEA
LSISSGGNLLYIPVERETLFRVSLKEQTAQATADVKRDAKAVAAGISEGWSRDKQLDLNAATKDQLLSLPGVTAAEADRVIAGRPYSETGDLVTRRIMPKTEYDEIANRLTAKK